MLLRRRPVLRAAAIGSGAYYAGKKRRQSLERDRLRQLGQLHERGVLTDEEFATQKGAILGGGRC